MPHKKHIRLNLQNQKYAPHLDAAVLTHAHELLQKLATPKACIGAYWPLPDEIDCRPLLKDLHSNGFHIALPIVTDQDMPMLYRAWATGDSLIQGYKTAQQPAADKKILQPDLLLIPLFGFRRDGYRLGRGGGFYDRTLADWRANGVHCVTIGLGHANREVPDLSIEAYDEKLDWIVTEKAIWSTKE